MTRQLAGLSIAIVIVIVWPSCDGVQAGDWPTYRHDNHRSGFTEEKIDVRRLALQWTWRSPAPPQPAWAGPAKWDAYAQIRNLPSMRNYDVSFHPIMVGDAVFFGSSADHSIHCLSANDGREKWSVTTDAPIRIAPSYSEGKLYFGSDDGAAYCLHADSGTLIWKFSPTQSNRRILNNGQFISPYACRTGVLIAGDMAYFGNGLLPWKDSYLCAVNAQTGSATGSDCYVEKYAGLTFEGAPALSSQLLITPQGRVPPRVFRRSDGKELGEVETAAKTRTAGSVVVVTMDEKLFHGPAGDTRRGGFQSSDPKTREMVARYGGGKTLVVAGQFAYMSTGEFLIASNLATRKQLWKVPCLYANALIGSGDIVIAGGDDKLAAFHTKDGKQIWRHGAEGKVFALAAANGRLLAGTDTGVIHSFGLTAQPTRKPELPEASETSNPSPHEQAPSVTPILPLQDTRLASHWIFQHPNVSQDIVKDLVGDLPATIRGKASLQRADGYQSIALNGRNQSILITADSSQAKLPKKKMTAEAWVRVDKLSNLAGIVGAVVDNGKNKRGWILGLKNSKFTFALAGVNGDGKLTYLTSKKDLSLRRWYHVVGTYDGATMKLYINGRLSNASTMQRGDIHYPQKTFYEIGAFHDSNDYYRLAGRLLEVRVYRDVLSAREVELHFNEKKSYFSDPLGPPRTDLLAAGPWLQFTQPGEATIRWRTTRPSPTRLFYRLDGPSVTVEDARPKAEHQVRLSPLKRNRTYSYAIQTVIDGQSGVTPQYECDTFFDYSVPPISRATDELFGSQTGPAAKKAELILARSGVDRGICLQFGVGEGDLAYHLARNSRLRVIVFETDANKVTAARSRLMSAGLYGQRVTVHHVEKLSALPLVSRFANLAVIERIGQDDIPADLAAEVVRVLRPDGGIAELGPFPSGREHSIQQKLRTWYQPDVANVTIAADRDGVWARIDRHPLKGAGEWSHLYGRADNSAFGGEELAGARKVNDLDVQWLLAPGFRPIAAAASHRRYRPGGGCLCKASNASWPSTPTMAACCGHWASRG